MPPAAGYHTMLEWLSANETALLWLTGASVVMFFGTLAAVPLLVARIPQDYFAHDRREPSPLQRRHPAMRLALHVTRNLVGLALVLAGIVMLFLPGQGVLTILMGVIVSDFPGKYALERRLVRVPSVLKSVNWLRGRAGRPPLLLTDAEDT